MNSKTLIGIVVVLVVIIGGYFMLRSSSTPAGTDTDGMDMAATTTDTGASSPAVTDTTPVITATSTVTATVGKTVNITVTGSSFAFAPKTISVNKGDTVNVHFVNSGGLHDFVIDEFNVRTPRINGGQSADVTFVADKSGTFEYYCSVGTHRAMGMWGTLTVN